jgi:hypothetical protein
MLVRSRGLWRKKNRLADGFSGQQAGCVTTSSEGVHRFDCLALNSTEKIDNKPHTRRYVPESADAVPLAQGRQRPALDTRGAQGVLRKGDPRRLAGGTTQPPTIFNKKYGKILFYLKQ